VPVLALADRAIFVANVQKEIAGKQLSLMAHHDCSRVLEKLVQVSTPEQLNDLLGSVAGKYVKAMTTRHSSHVLQTLLAAVAHHLDRHAAAMEGTAGARSLSNELTEALTVQVIAMTDVRTRARHAEATAIQQPCSSCWTYPRERLRFHRAGGSAGGVRFGKRYLRLPCAAVIAVRALGSCRNGGDAFEAFARVPP